MTPEQVLLYKKIDEILWIDWDPIGINDTPEARDEYYSYLPQIFKLKIDGADRETIAQHLDQIVTNRMGLFSNLKHCREVADKILMA